MTTTATRKRGTAAPEPPASLAARARSGLRKLDPRTTFTCHCGCNREWKDHRMWNAHFLKNYGGYWGGKAGKAMRRQIGKERDGLRRMARAGLEAHGHVDNMGRRTDRHRSRPLLGARPGLARMREADRHRRDHDRADDLDAKAARHRAAGRHGKADDRAGRAAGLRDAWPVRPAPARTAPAARQNGTARAPRAAPLPAPPLPPPGPAGRLASQPGNGARLARTRTTR